MWNELARGAGAAGCGVSTVFPVPADQAALVIRPSSSDGDALGRGFPDASGNADPLTGWKVVALRRLRSTGSTRSCVNRQVRRQGPARAFVAFSNAFAYKR